MHPQAKGDYDDILQMLPTVSSDVARDNGTASDGAEAGAQGSDAAVVVPGGGGAEQLCASAVVVEAAPWPPAEPPVQGATAGAEGGGELGGGSGVLQDQRIARLRKLAQLTKLTAELSQVSSCTCSTPFVCIQTVPGVVAASPAGRHRRCPQE
jgi:hypothetical protein